MGQPSLGSAGIYGVLLTGSLLQNCDTKNDKTMAVTIKIIFNLINNSVV